MTHKLIMIPTLMYALIGWNSHVSAANDLPSVVAELQRTVAALESRIASLEGQLQASNAQTQQAENATPRPILASLNVEVPASTPMQLGQTAAALQEPPSNFVWSGLYWGTSFGYGSSGSKSHYGITEQYRNSGTRSSTDFDEDGTSETDTSISVYEYSFSRTGGSDGAGRDEGALADLYLGATTNLTPRIVAGFQAEGTLAEMHFHSRLSKESVTQETRSSDTYSYTADDYASRSVYSSSSGSNGTRLFNGETDLKLDWMVSVIGRAGWLATPSTLLYGLAGWSYGHFETGRYFSEVDDFGSHGITVGGGIEQKLSPKWSLRAEYRYTDFGNESLSKTIRSNDTSSGSGSDRDSFTEIFDGETFASSSRGIESSSSDSTSTYAFKGSVENDLHIGRIGVTRYFTTGD